MEETIQIAENEIKEEEKINEEDINYNQNVIDEINNNPIGQDVMTDTISETTLETTSKINVMSSADTELKMSSDISLMSTSTAVPVEFKIEPVNAPFNVYNNSNESVSLATGAMNFEKTLLSFPGRNGLDLNLGIKYNSEDAVITENEFDDTADIRNSNFTSFAIGWSFNFTTILKNQNTYS